MLKPETVAMATGQNFAMFTTLRPDGHPASQVMWVDADDDCLLINTEKHRRKYANVCRDPRVTVTIWDQDEPYRYAEVRGEVVETVAGPEARAHIDALSMKYHGQEYRNPIQSERLLLRIKPLRQRVREA